MIEYYPMASLIKIDTRPTIGSSSIQNSSIDLRTFLGLNGRVAAEQRLTELQYRRWWLCVYTNFSVSWYHHETTRRKWLVWWNVEFSTWCFPINRLIAYFCRIFFFKLFTMIKSVWIYSKIGQRWKIYF